MEVGTGIVKVPAEKREHAAAFIWGEDSKEIVFVTQR